jgi:hypothetical protein
MKSSFDCNPVKCVSTSTHEEGGVHTCGSFEDPKSLRRRAELTKFIVYCTRRLNIPV